MRNMTLMPSPEEWRNFVAAHERLVKAATQALGLIVEFGDLNGFRNMSDQELGRSVVGVAKELAAALPPAHRPSS